MATLTLADTDLSPGPTKPSAVSPLISVKSSATVTTALTGYVCDWVPNLGRWARGSFLLAWTVGGATTLEVEVSTSPDGTDSYPDDEAAAAAAGVAAVAPVVRQYTAANYTTTGYIRIPLDLTDVRYARIRAKTSGGAANSTLVVKFVGGKGDA